MTQNVPDPELRRTRFERWEKVIVPTAQGLEAFFWRLAWFTLLVVFLFGVSCPRQRVEQGAREGQQVTGTSR